MVGGLSPHRKAPNRDRELRERAWALVEARLAGQQICGRCGANVKTYDARCTADLDEVCPGAAAMDAARIKAEKELGLDTGAR